VFGGGGRATQGARSDVFKYIYMYVCVCVYIYIHASVLVFFSLDAVALLGNTSNQTVGWLDGLMEGRDGEGRPGRRGAEGASQTGRGGRKEEGRRWLEHKCGCGREERGRARGSATHDALERRVTCDALKRRITATHYFNATHDALKCRRPGSTRKGWGCPSLRGSGSVTVM